MSTTIVLITGANSGVGLAATKAIASVSGDYHVVLACRSLEKAHTAIADLQAAGVAGGLSAVQLDVTDRASIARAAAEVQQRFGRLDTLINNAGAGPQVADLGERLQATLAVNTVGPALVAEAFRPLLLAAPAPRSVYVSSGLGSVGLLLEGTEGVLDLPPGIQAYCASKSALNMLAVRDMRSSEDTPLKVFVMDPGLVRSNLRGEGEENVSGGGKAEDASVAGELLLDILQGKRDDDMGKFIRRGGVWPW